MILARRGKPASDAAPGLQRRWLAALQPLVDLPRAERLLLQARQRHPRSAAARYLLADVALRQGKVVQSLTEMATLSRLIPGAAVELVPALAQYAQAPGAPQQLATIISANPDLKWPLLTALAADPGNTQLILALAGAEVNSSERQARAWQDRLLSRLVETGQYQRAYSVWRRIAGLPDEQRSPVFNPAFAAAQAPPPFNWAFASGRGGVGEAAGGHMRVLYYGRVPTKLATQLLLLEPGRYRFQAAVAGHVDAGALQWTVTCHSSGAQLLQIDAAVGGGTFAVPQSCPAQVLQLNGQPQEGTGQTDTRVGPVRLERAAS